MTCVFPSTLSLLFSYLRCCIPCKGPPRLLQNSLAIASCCGRKTRRHTGLLLAEALNTLRGRHAGRYVAQNLVLMGIDCRKVVGRLGWHFPICWIDGCGGRTLVGLSVVLNSVHQTHPQTRLGILSHYELSTAGLGNGETPELFTSNQMDAHRACFASSSQIDSSRFRCNLGSCLWQGVQHMQVMPK